MVSMLSIIRYFLFWFCIIGYIEYISERYGIKREVLPVVVFSTIGSLIFLSGLLNAMIYMLGLIFFTGIGLGIFVLYKKIKNRQMISISLPLTCIFVIATYLYVWLHDVRYYAFDNFSYWGLIVKNITKTSQLPNFDDTLIVFQSYPPGSACFIWFVCKIVGYSEGHTLFAHALFIVSCMVALYGVIKNNKKNILLYILVVVMTLLSITLLWGNNIYNLLVDIMLAVIAIAAFTIVEVYQNEIKKATVLVCPLLVFEVCVKNSGLIWVVAITGWLLCRVKANKQKKDKKDGIFALILCAGIPLLVRKLWDLHVDYVFVKGNDSSHAMSIEHYSKIFTEKSRSDLMAIHNLFFSKVISFENKFFWILLFYLAIGVCLLIFNRKLIKKSQYGMYLVFIIIVYLTYQIGNYCMYMFSMPLGEALYLAAYDRYVQTVEWFSVGVFAIYILKVLEVLIDETHNCKNIILIIGILIVTCMTLKVVPTNLKMLVEKPVPVGRDISRDNLRGIIKKNHIKRRKKYLIYVSEQPDADVGYRKYMARYVLYSPDVDIVQASQMELLNWDWINMYDYFVILDRDDMINKWLCDNSYPEDTDCIFVSSK